MVRAKSVAKLRSLRVASMLCQAGIAVSLMDRDAHSGEAARSPAAPTCINASYARCAPMPGRSCGSLWPSLCGRVLRSPPPSQPRLVPLRRSETSRGSPALQDRPSPRLVKPNRPATRRSSQVPGPAGAPTAGSNAAGAARDLGRSGASSAAAPRPAICGTGLRLVHRARSRGLAHRGRRVEAHVGGASLDPSRPNHNLLAVPEAPPAARSSDAFSRFCSIFKPLRAASDRPFPDGDDSGDRRKGPYRRGLATNRRNRMTKIITCSERAAPILPEGKQPKCPAYGQSQPGSPLPPERTVIPARRC